MREPESYQDQETDCDAFGNIGFIFWHTSQLFSSLLCYFYFIVDPFYFFAGVHLGITMLGDNNSHVSRGSFCWMDINNHMDAL